MSTELELHALRKANYALSEEVALLQNRLRIARGRIEMYEENRKALHGAVVRAQ